MRGIQSTGHTTWLTATKRIRALLGGLALALLAGGCASPPNAWGPAISNMTPGARARLAPPATGRAAFGAPDPYYQNTPASDGVLIERSETRQLADDDSIRIRDRNVAPAGYDDDWRAVDSSSGDRSQPRGMPKSGEPRRLRIDPDLVELTDLPSARSRRQPTILQPSTPQLRRTPSADIYDRSYERSYEDDYDRAASSARGDWQRRD